MKHEPSYSELKQQISILEKEADNYRETEKRVLETRNKLERRLKERTNELEILSSKLLSTQEEERKRIAGDLHDVIGQSLSAAKFMVETVLDQINGDKSFYHGKNSLKALVPMLQKASEEVRRIVMNLRPSILDNLGILATITWFCRQYKTIYSGIEIEKEINISEKDIPNALKTIIFRILQEAMNNIAKHSNADTIQICLEKTKNNIHLTIHDNGIGFDANAMDTNLKTENGFGLTSMKERAELSGGSFGINSLSNHGTTIKASWTLEAIRIFNGKDSINKGILI